jgi:Rrf2 family transcriptional regulator, iron-sulfur cluster assembly transcription factor
LIKKVVESLSGIHRNVEKTLIDDIVFFYSGILPANGSLRMLSQAVGYAVTAMGHIASAGGNSVLVREVADAAEIPAPYLSKIINSLARRGLVITQRGVGGGVTLAKAATEISMYDVCVALDDPIVRPACMLGTAECSDERACPAHKFWTSTRAKVIEFLQATNVADIASFESKRHWRKSAEISISAKPKTDPDVNTP